MVEEFLTPGDAAAVIRDISGKPISAETVKNAATSGRIAIAARTVNGTRLFRRAEVERVARERALRLARFDPAA